MAKNFEEFEVEAQDGGWAQFSTPPPPHHIMHRSSNAQTLPTSSHGSSYSASVRSSESSLEPPPEQQDDSVSGAGKDIVGGWTQTKTLMVVTTLLLLFGAGILGGLMATGGLSRSNNAIAWKFIHMYRHFLLVFCCFYLLFLLDPLEGHNYFSYPFQTCCTQCFPVNLLRHHLFLESNVLFLHGLVFLGHPVVLVFHALDGALHAFIFIL